MAIRKFPYSVSFKCSSTNNNNEIDWGVVHFGSAFFYIRGSIMLSFS